LRRRAGRTETPAERAQLILDAAKLVAGQGHTAEAVRLVDEAMAADPTQAAALHLRADLAAQSGDLTLADRMYARAAETSPEAARKVAHRRAEVARELGQQAVAEEQLRIAVADAPREVGLRQELAQVLVARGRLGPALTELRALATLLPPTGAAQLADVQLRIAELASRMGRPAEARGPLELALGLGDRRPRTLELAASIYAQLGAWDSAAELQEAISRAETSPRARAERLFLAGEIHRLQRQDLERANDCFLRASDIDATHVPTLWCLIEHYFRARDWEQLAAVARDLARAGAQDDDPLAPAGHRAYVGLAFALRGEASRAQAALGATSPAELAAPLVYALAGACLADVEAVVQAVPQAAALEHAVQALAERDPADDGAHRFLACLRTDRKDPRAPLHLAVLAFLGDGEGQARATPIDASHLARSSVLWAVHQAARGPLRDALARLARLGETPAAPDRIERSPAPPEIAAAARALADALAMPGVDVTVTSDPGLRPRCTGPRELLIPQGALALRPAELRFLCARALELARSGATAIDLSSPDEAASSIELLAERLRAGGRAPTGLADVLTAAARSDTLSIWLDGTRATAARIGWLATGDLGAALEALGRLDPAAHATRRDALRAPALADLVAFATGAACAQALAPQPAARPNPGSIANPLESLD
jgi:uncharacterized protein HemY